jgi:hypothetical protein
MMDRTPPQFIIGWFHSHPGIRVMLSQDDVKTQLAWQTNNPQALALVFNHVRLTKQVEVPSRKGDPVKPLQNDVGFLCFRLDDPGRGIEANYHEIPFEFTDITLDPSLVRNAQEFVAWVTKAFPREEAVVAESKKFIDNSTAKLNELFTGTESYLRTLLRKNESFRFAQVLETQETEANKILEQGNTMVSIYRMMMPYLEYKERDKLIPLLEACLKQWDDYSSNFLTRLKNLPQAVQTAEKK